jgi:hypothetical protein
LQKIKAGLDEEVQLMKREMEEMTKIKVDKIKNIYEVSSNPDQHLKMMKEASQKLLAAESEIKKLLVDNEK